MTVVSRRFTLLAPLATGLAAAVPGQVLALSASEAQGLVDKLVNDINTVIASGKSEAAMIKDFERIFARYSDTAYVASYAMGSDARRATAAQKKKFSTTFNGYIARKYGKRFREFIGGRLEPKDAKQIKNFYSVSTNALLRGEAPFDVTFHVSDRTGKSLFFNMYVEGINMLLTERAEVGAMLDKRRGDIDAMIVDLAKAG